MELKEGDYFTFIRSNSTDSFEKNKNKGYFIAKMGKKGYLSHYLYTFNNYFNTNQIFNGKDTPIEYRYITSQEKAHLQACIAANKFVPLSEVKEENILENIIIW